MAYYSESPVPIRILNEPNGGGQMGEGGASHVLSFLLGAAAGGSPLDIYTFLNWAATTTELIDMGGGVTVERIIPLRHPYLTNMVMVSGSWQFTGTQINAAPGWPSAKVTCEFGTPPYGLGGGDQPFYTVRTRFGGEFDVLPHAAMAFADGTRIEGDWGVFVPEIGLMVTTYQSPDPIGPAIATLTGRINSVPFLGWDTGYVRFDGVDSDFSKTVMGATTYVKNFAITFRPRLWNQVMRNDGTVEIPLNVTTGLPKYASADLNILLY